MPPRLAASEWTAIKQENFRSYLRAYSAIAATIQHKATWHTPPWLYFELTAGSGLIDNNGIVLALDTFREELDFRVNGFKARNPSF
jgi:hypothetical protein